MRLYNSKEDCSLPFAGRLQLKRPLVVFDLETTGRDRNSRRIVEFCAVKLFTDGSWRIFHQFINPDNPNSPESSQVGVLVPRRLGHLQLPHQRSALDIAKHWTMLLCSNIIPGYWSSMMILVSVNFPATTSNLP